MNNKIQRYMKLYPWHSGLTGDLLFYIAIDTLFLTMVKNLSAAEIVSISSFSQLACIAFQFPILFVIKKIGNTASIRVGSFFLLASAVFITFSKSYYLILLGRLFHDVAGIFKEASVVALRNNLDVLDKGGEFVSVRTKANTVYAVLTMLISFVASAMFNFNNYLPMLGCITTCAIGFGLSWFMKDFSDYNKIERKPKSDVKVKIQYSKIIIIAWILYAFFYSVVTNGQSEGKLFIQQNVMLEFDNETTALIIGAIVIISRVVRVVSNVIFVKLYDKYQEKMGVVLPILLCASFGLLLFGSFIPQIVAKIIVMTFGYIIILFIRDPYRLYIQDVVFSNTPKEQHQTLLAVFAFGVKVATAGTGLVYSAILLAYPMVVTIAIMFAIAAVEIVLSMVLYRAIVLGRAAAKAV